MSRMNDREQALFYVQQMGFMTDDIRLFLNTHPDCGEALCALKYYMGAERELKENYEKRFGPLTLEGVEKHGCYSWTDGPWPWEMEA